MQEFTKTDKMVHLVQNNHSLLPVIHRFGIRLGFGNKTVEELCSVYGVNTDFFLAIVNTFHNKNYFPKAQLLSFSPLLIVDYLKKTHAYYVGFSLPQIEELIHQLLLSTPQQNSEMKMIETFYLAYKRKLLEHLKEEEETIFPYVEMLVLKPQEVEHRNFDFNFEKEHEHVDFELNDLKKLILKYLVPEYDEWVCNKLMEEIYRFEKDMHDHSRMEDAILIPHVLHLMKTAE
ncbi:hemerythrin domain-containing protein [Maribellus sp. CM-23]|uniref:hemerythrin domain-containing protein n=1 Tax=Maribellus sp. CM-23 TaxID=2781026 RepID=UPI001F3DDB83|nr:hemerythrin domain-containing protein [Maribellus sp. CM-23]MCE4564015.1 hemerythrin domain-containing protein [Maribellus sp. CM-23]